MPIIIGGVLVIALITWVLDGVVSTVGSILTLSFLPSALKMLEGSSMDSTLIPILGYLINWLVVVFVNFVDFMIWFINWIPGIKQVIRLIYTAPDIDQSSWYRASFSFLGGHRSFITHSVLNPIFIIYFSLSYFVSKVFSRNKWGERIGIITALIGLTFVCHLLADTMPEKWQGFAYIKIFFWSSNAWVSQIWLFANALFALFACAMLVDGSIKIKQMNPSPECKVKNVEINKEVEHLQNTQDNTCPNKISAETTSPPEIQQQAASVQPLITICAKCGIQLEYTSGHCKNCGAPIIQSQFTDKPLQTPIRAEVSNNKSKNWFAGKTLYEKYAIVGTIVAIVVALFTYSVGGKREAQKMAGEMFNKTPPSTSQQSATINQVQPNQAPASIATTQTAGEFPFANGEYGIVIKQNGYFLTIKNSSMSILQLSPYRGYGTKLAFSNRNPKKEGNRYKYPVMNAATTEPLGTLWMTSNADGTITISVDVKPATQGKPTDTHKAENILLKKDFQL